jgi:3-hydroxyisobutyrate dehydrogenase
MSTTTVGLIGLGAMGSGMATSLRRAGHNVHVFDVRREVAVAFAKDGGVAHDSLASLGAACDVIVSVVVNAAQTESVVFGDGTTPASTSGCAASMTPGSVFIMCSTVDPNWSVALEARLEALGLLYVDAPISGGAAKAASGEMTMMTAAKPAAYAVAEPLLSAMAAKVYKLGDSAGAGSKVKIINQLLAGVHIAAAAEAMALGLREGVDAAALSRQQLAASSDALAAVVAMLNGVTVAVALAVPTTTFWNWPAVMMAGATVTLMVPVAAVTVFCTTKLRVRLPP